MPKSPFSDQGPENPKLGNRAPQRRRPAPPTSGMTGQDGVWDYFRDLKTPRRLKTEPDATVTPARVTLSVRMRYNPILGLDAERVVNYLDQWRLGFFRQAGMLWDQMERRDYMLQTVAPKRKKAVARNGFEILTVANVPASLESLAAAQQKFLQNFYDHLTVTTALEPDEQGGFALLVRQMMDAIGKRYAVHEIIWQPDAAGNLTAKFIFCPIWWFEGTRGKLRFLESEFQVYGKDMNPGEWLVTVHDGLMEASSLAFVLKHLPLKSWAALCDKFGQPGILGKTDAPYAPRNGTISSTR
jgi:phage gp29-like protein